MTKPTNLMAAAPMLYEALSELVKCHATGGFVEPDKTVLENAEMALAFALGEHETCRETMTNEAITFEDFRARVAEIAPHITDEAVLMAAWEDCAWIATLTNDRIMLAIKGAINDA